MKLPRLWPNSSLSISSVGIAPQLTGTNGAVVARAALVDQPRHQFLAGAGLAGDVDRRLAARDAGDQRAQLLHGRRAAEQLGLRALVISPESDGSREPDRHGDQPAQDAEVERLGDEIEGAELQGAHRDLDVAVRA